MMIKKNIFMSPMYRPNNCDAYYFHLFSFLFSLLHVKVVAMRLQETKDLRNIFYLMKFENLNFIISALR